MSTLVRCGRGNYYLSSQSFLSTSVPITDSPLNGPIFTLYECIRNAMTCAVEAKIGGIYLNGQVISASDKT